MSAFWILVANSFMQNPVGYRIAESGRAEMTDFIALITNPNVWLQFPHVAFGGLATGAFFIIGISAFHLLRNKSGEEALKPFRASMRLALIIGTIAAIPLAGFGHAQGQRMADTQPMKLAAAEGLWNSEDPASLSMFQIGDETNRQEIINIRIPSLLSFLAYNTPDGLVQGMNQLQEQYVAQYGEGNYIPPMIWLTYWSFRAMVGAGVLMTILGIVGLFFFYTGRLNPDKARTFLMILVAAIILPYLAGTTGWLLAEVGRQPWIVQGLMTIEQALSPNVTVEMLFISLVGFALLYGALMAADIYLLQKYARRNMDDSNTITPWLNKPEPAIDQQPRLEGAY